MKPGAAITGSKGQNAPSISHCRENCVVHLFATDPTKRRAFLAVCDGWRRCAAGRSTAASNTPTPRRRARKQARAAALLQQAGGAPAGAVAQPAHYRWSSVRTRRQAWALCCAATQVPVEAGAPGCGGHSAPPYQRQSLAFMLDIETPTATRVFRSTRWRRWTLRRLVVRRSWDGQNSERDLADPRGPGLRTRSDGRPVALRQQHYSPNVVGPPEPSAVLTRRGRYTGLFKKNNPNTRSRQATLNPSAGVRRRQHRRPDAHAQGYVMSCPVTLIGQWQDEIRRWAPNLRSS